MGACTSGGKGSLKLEQTFKPSNAFKHINNEDAKMWMNTHSASNFIEAPETIEVGNVRLNWIGDNISTSNGKKQYRNTYQSTVPMSNGEYPIFEVVVNEVRRGKQIQYVFDNSPISGTGLR